MSLVILEDKSSNEIATLFYCNNNFAVYHAFVKIQHVKEMLLFQGNLNNKSQGNDLMWQSIKHLNNSIWFLCHCVLIRVTTFCLYILQFVFQMMKYNYTNR